MKMKKVTAMGMAALMAATMIPSVPVMADGGGKVYYLNFKPEADEAWQNLAKAYTEETGTEVTVVTERRRCSRWYRICNRILWSYYKQDFT